MPIAFTPIGFVENPAADVPRHWTVSDLEGTLVIQAEYAAGLCDIKAGDIIVVLFHFHQSEPFTSADLRQAKRKDGRIMGVFSICSPRRQIIPSACPVSGRMSTRRPSCTPASTQQPAGQMPQIVFFQTTSAGCRFA